MMIKMVATGSGIMAVRFLYNGNVGYRKLKKDRTSSEMGWREIQSVDGWVEAQARCGVTTADPLVLELDILVRHALEMQKEEDVAPEKEDVVPYDKLLKSLETKKEQSKYFMAQHNSSGHYYQIFATRFNLLNEIIFEFDQMRAEGN